MWGWNRFAVSTALALAAVAGSSGCIMVTPRYSLVDFNRPSGLFDRTTSEGAGSVVVGVVAVSLIGAPLGWVLYRRRRSRVSDEVPAQPTAVRDEPKSMSTTAEEPACSP
jgi:hypothetical protein